MDKKEEVISVELPNLPTGLDFEDYIAAHFQSVGFFVEKNISVENILQLDISITDYHQLPHIKLIEIKSGNWEFNEVFKLKGWMVYSNISKGMFIVKKGRERFDYYRNVAHELGIQLLAVPELDKTNEYLEKPLKGLNANSYDIESFRYSYWMEREYLRILNVWKKTHKSVLRFKALEDYYFKINCEAYFTSNLLDKTKLLYEAYNNYFHITAKCANEIKGSDFNSDHDRIPNDVFRKTFYQCDFNLLQISTYLECQSRIRLLKCAVDYLLFKEVKDKRADDTEEFLGLRLSKFNFLPKTYTDALSMINSHSYFKLYPCFWQWFINLFGGFILLDIKDQEYELLSFKTGIPFSEIDNALSAFDILFPIQNGWFKTNKLSNIKELKVSSMPFRGIGANYRRLTYCKRPDGSEGEFDELPINREYGIRDLKKWNNLAVEVLANASKYRR